MLVLGTTGTRSMTRGHVINWLSQPITMNYLGHYDKFVTGACKGWDALFGEEMVLRFPHKLHHIVVPANTGQVAFWWMQYVGALEGRLTVEWMAEGTSYKQRNQRIVDRCDHLLYAADYPEKHGKSLRSGTWQTVRLARAAEKPVEGFVINSD